MAIQKSPSQVNDVVRPESDLSQVLSHGPAMSTAYGKTWGGLIMLAAIMKASRGPVGIATAITLICTVAYKLWFT
jgi:hypothetical protein